MAKNNFLNFHKPETLGQWIVFLAAIGITLSSPAGTVRFLRELEKYLLDYHGKSKLKYTNHDLSQALYYLKKREIINIEEADGKTVIHLTEKGKKRKLQYDFNNMKISKQDKWDKKWRFVMFDIPEEKKFARESFRNKLRDLGFYQFQKSVWIYPYPCDDEVDFIAENFSIGQYVNLILVQMDDDKPLRDYFKLA